MSIYQIDPKTLINWQKNLKIILIDVREVHENNAEKIANSTLIPLGSIDIDKLPDLNDSKLIIYCRSGKRSMVAAEHLIAQNPDLEIYNYLEFK
jgi:rhodanese-related sulfurtransferase